MNGMRGLMRGVVFVAALAVAFVVQAKTTASYVQDGLIACWDGYENAGADGHETSLTEWTELNGRFSFVFNTSSGITVDGGALVFPGTQAGYAKLDAAGTDASFEAAKNGTVEVVLMSDATTGWHTALQSSAASGIGLGQNGTTIIPYSGRSDKSTVVYDWSSGVNTFSTTYKAAIPSVTLVNGGTVTAGSNSKISNPDDCTYLGHGSGQPSGKWFKGKICAIRLYSGKLTSEQIATNRAVDVQRFVEGDFANEAGVSVKGTPFDCVSTNGLPQYGLHPYAVGDTVNLTAPATMTIASDGRRADCLGWKLYNRATGALVSESTDQNKTVCSFTYSIPVRLVWQWKVFRGVTIANFDEDLATVYVNDVATTDGQVVSVEPGSSVKIELKDFRNDYYFRWAPASQTDRNLAFESWEGVPSGCETANPATFTPESDLTITPNVDVKGFAWQYATISSVAQITNHVHRWKCDTPAAASRTLTVGACIENIVGATENNLVFDCVERVRYNGKNYTITAQNVRGGLNNSRIGTWALAPRFSTFGAIVSDVADTFLLTNFVGISDLKAVSVGNYTFFKANAAFNGPVTNFVARRTTTFGGNSYCGRSGMTGELLLETVTSIGVNSSSGGGDFNGCTGLTAARLMSPYLKTIWNGIFTDCTGLKEVTIGSSVLESVSSGTFPAVVTNFIFLAEAPTATIMENIAANTTKTDGAHKQRFTVDAGRASWWNHVSDVSAAEVAAGLPNDCMGTFVDSLNQRRAWIVSSIPLAGVLLVGDKYMIGMAGYEPQTGLSSGDSVVLTAPGSNNKCELQHRENGVWTTYQTVSGTTVNYTHAGELTRAVWSVDGVFLRTTVNCYNGTITPTVVSGAEVAEGVYSQGSVVRLVAAGATAHPTSHFVKWTQGIAAADVSNATVEVTLNADLEVGADFFADEWIYSTGTGQITDGEWTSSSATLTEGKLAVTLTGGRSGSMPIDLSLPVHDADDYATIYVIKSLGNSYMTAVPWVRVGPQFEAFTSAETFRSSTVLERIDGLGASKLTVFPGTFLHGCDSAPIHKAIYEANDFIPIGLTAFNNHCYGGGPYLVGTFELDSLAGFGANGSSSLFTSYAALRDRLGGVTNLLLTCEALQVFPADLFSKAKLQSVTIASTNLTTASSQAFGAAAKTLKEIVFLAYPPTTAAAFDNLIKAADNTNMVIRCSKRVPGWKEMRSADYWTFPEWPARPAGTWGMYQTAAGDKRYYLVQRDSKYDVRHGLYLILK